MGKDKVKLFFLRASSFSVSVLPLLITFFVNRKEYITSVSSGFKLTIGGIVALVLVGIKAFGKAKLPRRVVVSGIIFMMAYLLQPMLKDFVLLSGMFFAGESADTLFFTKPIAKISDRIKLVETERSVHRNE